MEDLDEVMTYHHEALTLRPPGHPDRSMSLNNLANALLAHYKQSGSMEDLEEAITYHHEALTLCPPGHPGHCTSLNNLAIVYLTRYENSSMVEDFEESFLLREQAVNDLAASSMYRLTIAIQWAHIRKKVISF